MSINEQVLQYNAILRIKELLEERFDIEKCLKRKNSNPYASTEVYSAPSTENVIAAKEVVGYKIMSTADPVTMLINGKAFSINSNSIFYVEPIFDAVTNSWMTINDAISITSTSPVAVLKYFAQNKFEDA